MTNYLPNGAEIIAINYQRGTVLAHNRGSVEPYVTWAFIGDDLGSTWGGHYYNDLESAQQDFNQR